MIDQAGIMIAQGRAIACERIQGVNDNMSKSHFHDYFELYYLEEGERFHIIQDQLYCIHPGEFVIFSPYVMHHSYGENNVPFKRLLIYFRRDQVDSAQLLNMLEQGTGVYKPQRREGNMVHRMMNDLLKEQDQPMAYQEDYLHALLNLLLLTIIRTVQTPVKPEKRNRITEVISYIHQNYQDEISIEKLAQMSYVSPYYLCREFKRFTNSTIIQYVNVTRVMNAQRMFMETDKNITEISKDTGFSNITHFNRVFKGVAGMTPSHYRKLYRSGSQGPDDSAAGSGMPGYSHHLPDAPQKIPHS